MKAGMSAVEFVEHIFEGTGLNLYPQQVAILKAHYNEPLSFEEKALLLEMKVHNKRPIYKVLHQ